MRKRVLILAPYFSSEGAWINDFCARPDLEFRKARFSGRPTSWHERGRSTPPAEWINYFAYAARALRWRCECVVTSFPQLALVAAMLLRSRPFRTPRLVAWNFNLGSLASRWKGRLAGRFLDRVDRFIVHARSEVRDYARWLDLEESKFRFVPLQRGHIGALPASPIAGPYAVSMGSANRDYTTLAEALRGTGIRTVVIAKPEVLQSLPAHPELKVMCGLGYQECNAILAGALLNVVPIADGSTASGQVTFTTAMRLGVATVATRCVGTVDYIRDRETGLLVAPGDPAAMRAAIEALWRDAELRRRLGEAARRQAEEELSDEAAACHLARTIDEVLAL